MSTPDTFIPEGDPSDMSPEYTGPDANRERLPIQLFPVATGYNQPTDVQFVPGNDLLLVVLEKTGAAHWRHLKSGAKGELLKLDVLSDSEQGLLGLAFHPKFGENGRFFINYTTSGKNGKEISRISEWRTAASGEKLVPARGEKVILELEQPYANHNAGQLQFGDDGYLYIGFGDGGWAGDPNDNGQNKSTLLGSMIRIDIDRQDARQAQSGKAYAIPSDNPFVNEPDTRPEIWAFGLRNPWRYSLDKQGRVIVGDVGEQLWEEITVVSKGENHGWSVREGRHCFKPTTGCPAEGFVPPAFEYKHGEHGSSITGGYQATGNLAPALHDKYVFGDFISGRLWAIDLPETVDSNMQPVEAYTLGKWPILPATFGRNNAGDVFVADFSSGTVFAIAATPSVAQAE